MSLLAAAVAFSSHAMAVDNASDIDQTGFANGATVTQGDRNGNPFNAGEHTSDIDQTGAFNGATVYQSGVASIASVNQQGLANMADVLQQVCEKIS